MSESKDKALKPLIGEIMRELPEEITIRFGEAQPQEVECSFVLDTSIEGPRKYVEHRQLSKQAVVFTTFESSIRMNSNPFLDRGQSNIYGQLRLSKDVNTFKDGNRFTPEQLYKALRSKGLLFSDKKQFNELMIQLRTVNAKINRAIKQEKNNSGDSLHLVQTTVESNLMTDFMITLPLFEGDYEPVHLRVQIILEPTSSGVMIEFFIEELESLVKKWREKIISKEVKMIEALGYLVMKI